MRTEQGTEQAMRGEHEDDLLAVDSIEMACPKGHDIESSGDRSTRSEASDLEPTVRPKNRSEEIDIPIVNSCCDPSPGRRWGSMSIPRGTRQYIGLRELANRLGWSHKTVRYWWQEGRIIGRLASGPRARVLVPIELAEFYLRYTRMPTKLELFELDVLTRDYLLELGGPDGGLSELPAPICPTRSIRSQVVDGSSATTVAVA